MILLSRRERGTETDGDHSQSCLSSLLIFVYHCFDRVVIHGYLSGLSRPGQVVHFFRKWSASR